MVITPQYNVREIVHRCPPHPPPVILYTLFIRPYEDRSAFGALIHYHLVPLSFSAHFLTYMLYKKHATQCDFTETFRLHLCLILMDMDVFLVQMNAVPACFF